MPTKARGSPSIFVRRNAAVSGLRAIRPHTQRLLREILPDIHGRLTLARTHNHTAVVVTRQELQ